MIFALNDSGLWGYVDGHHYQTGASRYQYLRWTKKTQDKVELLTKDDARALGKIGRICNKTVQLGVDANWLLFEDRKKKTKWVIPNFDQVFKDIPYAGYTTTYIRWQLTFFRPYNYFSVCTIQVKRLIMALPQIVRLSGTKISLSWP